VSLFEPFELVSERKKVDVYATPIPVAPALMARKEKGTHNFGVSSPPGFELHGPEDKLSFYRFGREANSWGFDQEYLYVGVAKGSPRPDIVDYFVVYPDAVSAESSLNRVAFDGDDEAFVQRGVTLGMASHEGLFLPAPAEASWTLTVPTKGVLSFRGRIMEPPIRSKQRSDGASVEVSIRVDGVNEMLHQETVSIANWSAVRVDLAAYEGKEVTLSFRTSPGNSADYDYVFLEGPSIYTPSENPRRAVMVFVDTLRPDHLGTYGYTEVATSPTIDRFASHGVVFEEARSVAPWTLPSARAVLSGAQPELWFEEATVAERFQAAGWHTEAVVTNAFLSQPFGMQRGWTHFQYDHLASAREVIDASLERLSAHEDRDVLLMVHLMDPHLPYEEPWTYRWRYAGSRPDELKHLTRKFLTTVTEATDGFEAIRDHVIGRYNNNIRYADDQLRRLFADVGSQATVVLFSDHGEEFWEHEGFEHGHTFHDELLRVPLIVRSPDLPAGRVSAPVSLLDIAPTMLALEGIDSEVRHGQSLVGVASGRSLSSVSHAFGRPLYGPDGWGVVADDMKWYRRASREHLFDLGEDPMEMTDRRADADLTAYPQKLSEALGREVVQAWRVKLKAKTLESDVTWRIQHPDGLEKAWSSYDPRGRAAASTPVVERGGVTVHRAAGGEAPAAVYVLPPVDNVLDCTGLTLDIEGGGAPLKPVTCDAARPSGDRMLVLGNGSWGATVDVVWVPVPEGVAVSGFDARLAEQLKELGYVE
jgi:arylsulfatase A-like enzyme